MGQFVVFIGELIGHEVLVGIALNQRLCLFDSGICSILRTRQSDFGAKGFNHFSSFDGNLFAHDDLDWIPFNGSNHRQTNAGIA